MPRAPGDVNHLGTPHNTFVRRSDGSFVNDSATALIRPSRVAQDHFSWWITCTASVAPNVVGQPDALAAPPASPGRFYYYANRQNGADVPVSGWEYHPILTNGLGWWTHSRGVTPAPILVYVLPEGGPDPFLAPQ